MLLSLLACTQPPAPAPAPVPVPDPAPSVPVAPPNPSVSDSPFTFTTNEDFSTGIPTRRHFDSLAHRGRRKGLGRSRSVKLLISGLQSDPVLRFLNTREHQLHYPFVRDVLGWTMTGGQFASRTYHGDDRDLMSINLVAYPDLERPCRALGRTVTDPVLLRFDKTDTLTPALARRAHQLVRDRMPWLEDGQLLYVPPNERAERQLAADEAAFLDAGVPWMTDAELRGDIQMEAYTTGVTFGTLRVLTPDDPTPLTWKDVVVLPRLPNTLPLVAGTLSAELQTPLAHVNVAARARGTPNLGLIGAVDDARVAPLIGQLVRYEVTADGFTLRPATRTEAEAHWFAKGKTAKRTVPAADLSVDGLPSLDALGFASSTAVGAKAANVAELGHLLGHDVVPAGFAVPFVHYERFMQTSTVSIVGCLGALQDTMAEGRSAEVSEQAYHLCKTSVGTSFDAHVARILANDHVAADPALRDAVLDNLRWLVHHHPIDPTFAAALDARVAPMGRVRLRSSTNAEDLPDFSGAGLYRSVSAEGSGVRAASSRIRKVWASVWSWRAFEERSFAGIDHRAVKMAVLVHPGFPDEAANGVILTGPDGIYVNAQLGEIPVTNPVDGVTPEVFTVADDVVRSKASSLAPEVVTDSEARHLRQVCDRVAAHFGPLYDGDVGEKLDLEFKLHGPERRLVIKQVRPYVEADAL